MTKPKFGYWRFEYRYIDGQWKTLTHYGHRPGTADNVRGIRPLYEHPAPQPATDPAVEAARRKALRGVLALLDSYPWACDTAPVRGDVTFGVLRDLVGQPRKYPDRAIRGYDNDGPPGPHPVFGKREPEPDLKVSATMRETHVNTADLAKSDLFDLIVTEIEPETPADEKALRRLAAKLYEEGYSRDAE